MHNGRVEIASEARSLAFALAGLRTCLLQRSGCRKYAGKCPPPLEATEVVDTHGKGAPCGAHGVSLQSF